ncbi:MAG: ATP-binding protein [Actinomycetota bacterium]|nr:ATP-binding protein [Actinomycetota bacterium]
MTTTAWVEANQRSLVNAIAAVKGALRRHCQASGQRLEPSDGARRDGDSEALDDDEGSALAGLCALFGLSTFERDVLVLCAGMELDASVSALCAAAQGAHHAYPTFGLALAALDQPHWSALVPAAPLRHWRLIELCDAESLTTSRLRIDERVLHHLTGIQYLADELQASVHPVSTSRPLPPSHAALAARIADHLVNHLGRGHVALCGPDLAAQQEVAAAAYGSIGKRPHTLRADDVPAPPAERESFARIWEREAALGASGLVLDCRSLEGCEPWRKTAVSHFVDRLEGAVVTSGSEALGGVNPPGLRLEVGKPTMSEQRHLWQSALGPLAEDLNGGLGVLVAQFDVDADTIAAAAAEACCGPPEPDAVMIRLWDACRSQGRPRLDDLAQRVTPVASWNDLVLPGAQRQTLEDIAAHVRQRTKVYDDWGFAAKGSRGLGISAAFAGPSGTGKTMAAEVLANELRLELYRIDLSAVVSKYIGETEKNLRRLFDAAEGTGAILLFDEADALFGKRTEVKDSHDRYANIEVSYLLQRMETYRGLAILTTNFEQALDTAFLRRIRFVVQFPIPDAAQRQEIWRRLFPAATPVDALDLAQLACLSIPGGNIRNIGLNAAFLAADAGQPVSMELLRRSVRSEYAKLNRPLSEIETGGWE